MDLAISRSLQCLARPTDGRAASTNARRTAGAPELHVGTKASRKTAYRLTLIFRACMERMAVLATPYNECAGCIACNELKSCTKCRALMRRE
jgi:hypothetical protein